MESRLLSCVALEVSLSSLVRKMGHYSSHVSATLSTGQPGSHTALLAKTLVRAGSSGSCCHVSTLKDLAQKPSRGAHTQAVGGEGTACPHRYEVGCHAA